MDDHKTTQQLQTEIEAAKAKVELDAVYQHYKNKQRYKPLYFATQEADDELAVVYQQLYGENLYFTRPVAAWIEEVEWEGQRLPRFKKVSS